MIRKFVVMSVAVAFILSPVMSVNAQTTDTVALSAQVQALLEQITLLQTQIGALRAAQQQVSQSAQTVQGTLTLIRSLSKGMSGDDVLALQAVLAADPSIYPEGLVTGYFGSLTEVAVKKFQKKFGIEQVGFVGPQTRGRLNLELKNLGLVKMMGISDDGEDDGSNLSFSTTTTKVCIPPGHLIAPGWKKTHGGVEQSIIPVCSGTLPYGIAKKLPGYTFPTTTPTTTPPVADTTAPVISNVEATSTTAISTTIKWNTNEAATSRVWYDTVNPLSFASTTPNTGTADLVSNHSVPLSDLATSTTYYYVVVSGDSSGNIATSSQYSVATLNE